MSSQLTLDTVKEMAKLTMVSGRINEIQEKNLKMYPFVFFDNVDSVKIDYDFSNSTVVESKEDREKLEIQYKLNKSDKNNLRVTYYLNLSKDNDMLDKRLDAINKAVKNLFWKEVKVEIYFNDILVYNGEKRV